MAEAPKKKSKWIKSAVKHPGAFKAKAVEAGKTTREFAAEKANAPGKLGKEARLAETLIGMHHGTASKADRLYRSKSVRRGA